MKNTLFSDFSVDKTAQTVTIVREFDAEQQLVWDAFTKPELVRQWLLGPDGWTMPVCEINLKVGGTYRYVWRRDADGTSMGMGGMFHEVAYRWADIRALIG